MEALAKKLRVPWYRSPISKEELRLLNQRSNLKGFLQAWGYLGLLAISGSIAYFSVGRLPWPLVVLLLLVHGTCWAFIINAVHELVHDSVFKTRLFNTVFLYIFSFLGWTHHELFWASHTEHHKYTLHPPDDLEVILPAKLTLQNFLLTMLINPMGLYYTIKGTFRLACGKLDGQWSNTVVPESDLLKRRRLYNWACILLCGHLTIVVVSLVMGWWMLPVVITFAPFYGGGLQYLCNNCQHAGLQDNVPDYRICCRTVTLNPFLCFLYWQMNYHTEHHMYAAVPCYNLGKLHRLIRADLPPCPHGLYITWKQLIAIMARQKNDPSYHYIPELPQRNTAIASGEATVVI